MEIETPVISPCIISPVNPFVHPTSEKGCSEFNQTNVPTPNIRSAEGSKLMISAETGKFDRQNESQS